MSWAAICFRFPPWRRTRRRQDRAKVANLRKSTFSSLWRKRNVCNTWEDENDNGQGGAVEAPRCKVAEETGDLSDDQQSGRHEEKRRRPQNGVYFAQFDTSWSYMCVQCGASVAQMNKSNNNHKTNLRVTMALPSTFLSPKQNTRIPYVYDYLFIYFSFFLSYLWFSLFSFLLLQSHCLYFLYS